MNRSNLILLVEDNPNDVELTLSAMKRASIQGQIEVASDGAEACEYLFGTGRYAGRDTSKAPAMILMDVNLPGERGMDVVRRLRADPRTELIPTVMLTTSNEERDVQESYRVGANSYVCKPVDFREFTTMMKLLITYWLTLNEGPFGRMPLGGKP